MRRQIHFNDVRYVGCSSGAIAASPKGNINYRNLNVPIIQHHIKAYFEIVFHWMNHEHKNI